MRKTRLPEPKFAFAKKAIEESVQSIDSINPESSGEDAIVVPEQKILEVEEISKTSLVRPAKVEYTRITTQLASQLDRKLEYAVLILGKKKQDLINELLANGLDNLGISFPKL